MDFGPHGSRRLRPRGAPLAAAIVAVTLAAGCSSKDKALTPIPAYACPRPVVTSSYTAGNVQALGQKTVGTVVQFNVPANTASITVVLQGVKSLDRVTQGNTVIGNNVAPDRLTDPNGVVWFAVSTSIPTQAPNGLKVYYPVFFDSWMVSTGTLTIPNTSAGLATPLPSGTWRFTVYDDAGTGSYEPGIYDVTVLTKPGPAGASGLVDASFYLVTTSGLTASAAATDPDVQRLIQTLDTYLAGAGLGLGLLTFYDVNDAARAAYSTINVDSTGPCDELAQLLTLSQPGNGLDLFLVDQIDSASGNVVGMDGSIPGPSSFGGTIQSGMVVSLENLGFERAAGDCALAAPVEIGNCGDDFVAYIAAHEAGHFMGLYHTTESNGWFVDPISDTSTCLCSACRPGGATLPCYTLSGTSPSTYEMRAQDCSASSTCGGGDNLMFWQVTGSSTTSKGLLSAQQGQVMRANPVVQ